MKTLVFARRCAKEILRDPLNILFGLGFPVVLLVLLSAIQANIPAELFVIARLAPGLTVFGLSFLTLFSATLVARDRESAFLHRLYTTPLRPADFILGYLLPMLPMALGQNAVCYLAALPLGLTVTWNIPLAMLLLLPMSVFNIALGLLCGTLCNVKQVGGLCGALLTNLSAWLSGIWFDLALVGGAFERIAHLLPFAHAVKLTQAVIAGEYALATQHLLPVTLYAALALLGAVLVFLRQMKKL